MKARTFSAVIALLAFALLSACSLSSTASDSTTTLPTVSSSALSASSSDEAPPTTLSAIQTAAERYGTDTTIPPILTNSDTITTAGLGPVRVGHTLSEAQDAAGVIFNAASTGSEACLYYTPADGATGASFMVFND